MLVKYNNLEFELPDNTEKHRFDSKNIFNEIFLHDCYKIEHVKKALNISEKKIVWDVGSHLGFFSALCKIKVPECKIHSFEVIPIRVQEQKKFLKNFDDIKINLAHFLGYAEDLEKCKSLISKDSDVSTQQYIRDVKDVPKISVAQYLQQNPDTPDVVKIDMEGGEVGILDELNSLGFLKHVKIITGEWHFDKAYNYVKNHLNDIFDVEVIRKGSENNWNTFIAINKNINLN